MLIWCTLVTVLLLILPTLSQVITTTCEISSVEAGDNATLIIRFGEDLTQKPKKDFSVTHLDRNNKETEILTCVFSNGDVKCDTTPCCTWESKVTDVFRVYIHNASQQLEGKFWGFVIPADTKYQQYCNFNLKAFTCPTDPINATNSHVTCNNQSVTIGQSCTVICNSGYYFQENQTSVTYTCVGRNKWSPEIPVIFCEDQPKVHKASNLNFLFLLLIVILIVIVMGILFKKRLSRRKEKTYIKLKVTSRTTGKFPLKVKRVHCIKTASRSTTFTTKVGTFQLETILNHKIIKKAAKNSVIVKINWPDDQILKLEPESRVVKNFEETNNTEIMQLNTKIIKVKKQLEDEKKMRAQQIEEERNRTTEQMEAMEIRFTQQQEVKKRELNQLEEEMSRLKDMNEKHKEEMEKERKNVIRFVMHLEGRDRLLSNVLGHLEDRHLLQVVRQLLDDFDIRLLGVDSGLNFLMEVPASRWGEDVKEQLQGVLSDLVPETDRQEVTWSSVKQLDSSHDSDLRLGGTMLAPETATNQQNAADYWLECIRTWYPELQEKTYFLPPLRPQKSDGREDKNLERVLQCLQTLAEGPEQKEIMMVISQLQFGKYFGGPSYTAAVAFLPRPSRLHKKFRQHRYDKGDCDVLIIHSKLGLLTLEIKSVGGNFSQQEMTEQEQDDVVMKEIKKAVEQLNKAEAVLKHLTSDITNTTRISKILVLPNISSSQLKRAVNRTPDGQCFGVQNVDDAIKLCLLSDQLSDQHMSSGGNHNFSQALREWWQHVFMASGTEQLMTSSLYEQLVARITRSPRSPNQQTTRSLNCISVPKMVDRFCCAGVKQKGTELASAGQLRAAAVKICALGAGPLRATAMKICALGAGPLRATAVKICALDAGSVMCRTFALGLLRFCGPATTVEVHCVTAPRLNLRTLGEAVSESGERVARLVLFPQQVDILNRSPPRTFLSGPPGTGKTIVLIMQGLTWLQRGHDVHVVSTWFVSRAATTVIEHQLQETAKTSTARSRVHRHQFNFLKDEEMETAVRCLKSLSKGRQLCVIADEVPYDRKPFTEFCDHLIVQVPGVFIWGASVYYDARPLCLEEVKLTTPLGSPPVVVREVMESRLINQVHDYTVSDVPVPTDGPPVKRIKHSDHSLLCPLHCVECGHQIARVLTELDVGRKGDSNGPPPLKYRDVLVLFDDYPTDDQVKRSDLTTTTASYLVWGLRDRHVPVRVVEEGDEAAIRDTALGVGDLVTVANWDDVRGLQRKVVVVGTKFGQLVDSSDRLHAVSRCTSQLVLIDWRPV